MVGTLDNCLTRQGQRESAQALREFAVGAGVWRYADRQNDGVLVDYPGMLAQPWWGDAASVSAPFASLVAQLEASSAALQQEAMALMRGESRAFASNVEGVHEGGDWLEATLIPLGGGPLDAALCGGARLPKLCGLLEQQHAELDVQLARLSALRGATHVWPHCGPTNARLRLHLPLAVPRGRFTLTVGAEARAWEEGRAFVFDDSFRHEVQAAPLDADGVRLVLILDVWHPAVPVADRAAISQQLVAWSERRSSYSI